MTKLFITGNPVPPTLSKIDLSSAIDAFMGPARKRWIVRSVLGDRFEASPKHQISIERYTRLGFVPISIAPDTLLRINPSSVLLTNYKAGRLSVVTRYKELSYISARVTPELIARGRLTQIKANGYAKLEAASRFLPSGRLEMLNRLTPVAPEFMAGVATQLRRTGWLTLPSGVMVNPQDFTLLHGDEVELEFGRRIKFKDFSPADRDKIDSIVPWFALSRVGTFVNPAKILSATKDEDCLDAYLSVQCDDHVMGITLVELKKLRKMIGDRFLPAITTFYEEAAPKEPVYIPSV